MPRPPVSELSDADAVRLLEGLSSPDERRVPLEEQFALLTTLRGRSPEMAKAADQSLLGQIGRLRLGMAQTREHLVRLQNIIDKLSFAPWHLGVFLTPVDEADARQTAVVACNGAHRVVGLADGVHLRDLAMGDEVFLSAEMNVIMRKIPAPLISTGETAEFQHALPDGRLVVRHRDEDTVVRAAAGLDVATLASGAHVRWNRAIGLAFEPIERTATSHLFLEDTPSEGFEHIGGLDRQIAQLTRSLHLHLLHPEVAARYQVRRVTSVLLVGPPGTGKTMMARALANWLGARSSAGRSRFMSIKPGELHSMWYGQSEANYREAFRVARLAGDDDPATPIVMFFDEVDAVGAPRGGALAHVDDRVLTSFMTELDGLKRRGNILVVAATNRRDTLDPALARPGRLGDLVVEIPRPGMTAAAAVFGKHLPATVPYAASDGRDEAAARQHIIDVAVARLYAPNGEGEIASIMFRDSSRRAIRARDVMSGAGIANVARAAVERACVRDSEGGERGVTAADVLDAIADELSATVAALTPANCHAFVSGLPQDLAVVRVDPIVRKVRRPHRFVNVA